MAKGEGESSIAPFAGDTFAFRLAHCSEVRKQVPTHFHFISFNTCNVGTVSWVWSQL